MGLFDEIVCEARLPDGLNPAGIYFQTKSFPDPGMQRYSITVKGRLLDRDGNDVQPEGYICFYGQVPGKSGTLRFERN